MTFNGLQLLRWLLLQGRIECVQQFLPEISIPTQNQQIEIAVNAGIVRRVEERGALSHTFYVVNPELDRSHRGLAQAIGGITRSIDVREQDQARSMPWRIGNSVVSNLADET